MVTFLDTRMRLGSGVPYQVAPEPGVDQPESVQHGENEPHRGHCSHSDLHTGRQARGGGCDSGGQAGKQLLVPASALLNGEMLPTLSSKRVQRPAGE